MRFGVGISKEVYKLRKNLNAAGELIRENESVIWKGMKHDLSLLSLFTPEKLISRDRFGRRVLRHLYHSPHPD